MGGYSRICRTAEPGYMMKTGLPGWSRLKVPYLYVTWKCPWPLRFSFSSCYPGGGAGLCRARPGGGAGAAQALPTLTCLLTAGRWASGCPSFLTYETGSSGTHVCREEWVQLAWQFQLRLLPLPSQTPAPGCRGSPATWLSADSTRAASSSGPGPIDCTPHSRHRL